MENILKRKITGILLLVAVLALTACSLNGKKTQINFAETDWVDFVMLNDIQYIGNYDTGKLEDSSIEAVVGSVRFNASENVHDGSYKVKNGDAAYLPKGTELHKIKGYRTDSELRLILRAIGGYTRQIPILQQKKAGNCWI